MAMTTARSGARARPAWVAVLAVTAAFAAEGAKADAEFTSTPVTTAAVGETYRYDIETEGGFGTVRITAPQGLPSWLTLTDEGDGTATLEGVPGPEDADPRIVLRSEDGLCRFFRACYDFQQFDITIVDNDAPVVESPIADQSATVGQEFSLDVSSAFSDPDSDSLTFTATGLPQGLSITSAGTISGEPTQGDLNDSPFDVTVTAEDGRGGSASDGFELTITAFERADVSVEPIEADPSPVERDTPVEWTFTVANAGPSPASTVELTIDYAGNPFTFTDHPCTLTDTEDRQQLSCTLGPIPSDESRSVTVTGSVPQAGDIYVTAEIAESEPGDPDTGNNARSTSLNAGRSMSREPAQALSGYTATAVVTGDFDEDGFDDVAAATAEGEPTSVHLNLDDPSTLHSSLADPDDERRGLSAVPLSLEDSGASTDIARADLDNDGVLDLVLADGSNGAAYRNGGDASFTLLGELGTDATDSRAVAAADLDGDGFDDIALANAGVNGVYLNRTGGEFEAVVLPGDDGAVSVDVAAVDVVGSELPDLVFASSDGPALVYENQGSGEFAAPISVDPGPTSAIATADFNGDGYVDLVFGRASPGPSGVPANAVYLNHGTGGFVRGRALGASPTLDIATADIDGDDNTDIVVLNGTGAHQVYLGDGDGEFNLHPMLIVSRGAVRATTARVGRLQRPDLVVAGADGLEVFFNDGRGDLGLGDTQAPDIELNGAEELTIEVGEDYEDPGATATDDLDGELTPDVDDPVDPEIIGTYTVTYTAVDSAGNAASPVTRTVRVEAREATGGGGGSGTAGLTLLGLLLAAAAIRVVHGRRGRAPYS